MPRNWPPSIPVALAYVLFAASLSITGCRDGGAGGPGQKSDEIVIGEVGSMTGSEASFGVSTHEGIELALKQLNDKGGIKGKRVRLVSLDNQGKPEESATAVTRLITRDKVVAVLGEVASSGSLAMAPIAQRFKVPMISPASTNPRVTQVGDYVFRVCFIDPFQGAVMSSFALNNLKLTKVAILKDMRSDYSMGLSQAFVDHFTRAGGQILVEQSYSGGDMDFKSQLTAVRALKPEAIFVPGYYSEVGLIARQMRELGIEVPLLGGDGWDSPKLTEIGQQAIEGSYFSNHYSAQDQSERVQKFLSEYKASYGTQPDALAAMGYDAAGVLFDALSRVSDFNSQEIRDQIASTKGFPGVTGTITIDENRNAQKPAVVLKVENGQFVYQTTVEPT